MASAFITARTTKAGNKRFVVRFRLGGRAYPIEHGGAFGTMKEARVRRDLIAGELAAGRNPGDVLRALSEEPRAKTLAKWAAEWKASRLDLAEASARALGVHLRRILPVFGEREPQAIAWTDVQTWLGALAADGLRPGTIHQYVTTLRLLLDFAGTDPNPARDRRVKLPRLVVEEPTPPSAKQFLAILEHVHPRWRLALVVMEQTAMRVGEVHGLAWGDVDLAENRFRLAGGKTKTRRARWVQVPGWLMDEIAATCPFDDRAPERRVFAGFTDAGARQAMTSACRLAGIPSFSPHDLRHRRLTRWHHDGVPAKVLADRAGHAKASMSLDTYSHVLDPGEVAAGELERLLTGL
jgi:integrase